MPRPLLLSILLVLCAHNSVAQNDTSLPASDTFFLLRYNGLLGKLARTIMVDTSTTENALLERNDRKFQRFRGRVIRNIRVQQLEFGTPISDTGKKFTNTLVRMADAVHRQTREFVITNNLFFTRNDRLLPYLLADNERHLRSLEYLRDARIEVQTVRGSRDSVDVIVITKDVLSIGGSFRLSSLNRFEANVREDNLFGWGDRLLVRGLFDQERRTRLGYGAEYIRRNIAGTFIDGTLSYHDFAPTFNAARREETELFAGILKPLVNQYMRWTYAAEGAYRSTRNMYLTDSLYKSDFRYSYYNVDGWMAYNMGMKRDDPRLADERLRTIIGIRYLQRRFMDIPERFEGVYNFRYANITAILGSLSIFRQDFYKTRYVYGFGRNEDVPEGLDVSITTGWTKKQERIRGYAGLNIQMNYFSKRDNYYNYTLRVGGFTRERKFEDVDLLLNLEYFSALKKIGTWRQRTFVNAGITTQHFKTLNEPLFLWSNFGLPEYRNDSLFGGDMRATIKAESVFFTNWSLASFRFAPFVFTNLSWINGNIPATIDRHLFTSLGAGIRTRNESLIFGTLEFRGFFYPNRNFYNEFYRFEFATNLRFRYIEQLVKRPEFIAVN